MGCFGGGDWEDGERGQKILGDGLRESECGTELLNNLVVGLLLGDVRCEAGFSGLQVRRKVAFKRQYKRAGRVSQSSEGCENSDARLIKETELRFDSWHRATAR